MWPLYSNRFCRGEVLGVQSMWMIAKLLGPSSMNPPQVYEGTHVRREFMGAHENYILFFFF